MVWNMCYESTCMFHDSLAASARQLSRGTLHALQPEGLSVHLSLMGSTQVGSASAHLSRSNSSVATVSSALSALVCTQHPIECISNSYTLMVLTAGVPSANAGPRRSPPSTTPPPPKAACSPPARSCQSRALSMTSQSLRPLLRTT